MKKCTNKSIGESIGLYQFRGLDAQERESFLEHLVECDYCYDEVYSTGIITEAFRLQSVAGQSAELDRAMAALSEMRQPPSHSRLGLLVWNRFALAGASLAVFCVLLVVILIAGRHDGGAISRTQAPSNTAASHWAELQIPKAAYDPKDHGIVFRQPTESFDRAMAAYQENRFDEAIDQLETLSVVEPNGPPEVRFYLGVSLLLAGRNEDAIAPLRQTVRVAIAGQQEVSRFYLALAYLKADHPQQAIPELASIIAMNGTYRDLAERLKRQAEEVAK
jgi:tetratricopeptide (TPR) repeat protein